MSGRSWLAGAVLLVSLGGLSVVAWANSPHTAGVLPAQLHPQDCASGRLSDGAPDYGVAYVKDSPEIQAEKWAKVMGLYDSFPDATRQVSYADDTTEVIEFVFSSDRVAQMSFGYTAAFGWQMTDFAACST